jgi:membrane-associated phospholipid phosphatase
MLKHLVTPGLMGKRRMACRLTLEALEDRLLLSGDMVLRWNDILWASLQTANPRAPFASRIAAIVQAAVYDAVNSIDATHTPYLVAIPAPSGASEDAAAATAAHDTLVAFFPDQVTNLDLQLQASLQGIPDGDSKTAGIQVGQVAAQNILAARAHDGSDQVVNYIPGTAPGDWQPTPPAYASPVAPQWPQVTPFGLKSGSQFRPPPPPALTSQEYTDAFNQIKDLGSIGSTTRTADQTEAALFWQGLYASPCSSLALMNEIAVQAAVAKANSLVDNARLFALVEFAQADAYIACWDAKYAYNFWRPVTAIRAADTDGNPDTLADPNWTPLMATPAHPSYPSGHSTDIGSIAAALASFFGTDAIPFSLSYAGLPGVTRSYDSFTAAANECGQARIWVGFHWNFDVAAGDSLGRSVGAYIFQNFLLPRGGAAAPPTAALIHLASNGLSPVAQTGISLGSFSLATLPVEQSIVNPVPSGTTGDVIDSGTRVSGASHARLEEALPGLDGKSTDDLFGSADLIAPVTSR